MAIDPKKRKQEREDKGWTDDGPGTDFMRTEGKFPMAVAGWERFRSSQKGTPGLMVRLVVVEGPQAGHVTDRNFWLTPNALEQLADFALAFGYEEPFDEHSDDALDKIVVHGTGVVMGTVKGEGYTKRDGSAGTKYEVRFFGTYKGTKKDSWNEFIKKGEGSFGAYLQWRAANPRPEPGQAPQGGGGYNRGGGSQQGGGGYGGGGAQQGSGDEDIPF